MIYFYNKKSKLFDKPGKYVKSNAFLIKIPADPLEDHQIH